MQIQFKGHTYHLAVGNLTIPIPGDVVSSRGRGLSVDGIHLNVCLTVMSSLRSVSTDPQHHAPGLVPTLLHLLNRHQHQWWLCGSVLCVLEVYQTKIKSRMVIHAQTPAHWRGTWADPSTVLPFSPGAPSWAHGRQREHRCSATPGPQHCSGTGWPQDGSRIKTVKRDSWSLARVWDHWACETHIWDTYNVANLFPFDTYLYTRWEQIR